MGINPSAPARWTVTVDRESCEEAEVYENVTSYEYDKHFFIVKTENDDCLFASVNLIPMKDVEDVTVDIIHDSTDEV